MCIRDRYSRIHLAYLTAICALKQVLPVKDVSRLIRLGMEGQEPREIYDYFRLLYARIGVPHCPKCGKEIKKQTVDQMVDQIMDCLLYTSRCV